MDHNNHVHVLIKLFLYAFNLFPLWHSIGHGLIILLAGKFPELVVKRGIKKKVEGAFHIKVLAPNDNERVLDFLRRLFFRDEPMAKAVKLLDGPNDRCPQLEEYIGKALADGISLEAVDDNGELVGVVINSRLKRTHSIKQEEVEKCTNPKFKIIIRFMAYLEINCKLWEKVPSDCKSIVDLKIASTDPKWRGRHIMENMVEKTECIAKETGACAVHLVASSAFSKRAVERLGYKMIYSVNYADKPDAPQPEPPHVEACVFLKLL